MSTWNNTKWMAAVGVVLLAASGPLRADTDQPVWRIGQMDRSGAEFLYAPGEYARYAGDAVFIVGRSQGKTDWPYVLPGPDDPWAGGRDHHETICFGLKAEPRGDCRLVMELVDTHQTAPPVLTFDVNGHKTQHATTPGGGDASIHGRPSAGRPSRLIVYLPAGQLHAGLNTITVTNDSGSWALFDAIRLEGPATLAPASTRPAAAASARRLVVVWTTPT